MFVQFFTHHIEGLTPNSITLSPKLVAFLSTKKRTVMIEW